MSSQPPEEELDRYTETGSDRPDEEEAFMDLDDPTLRVVDDGEAPLGEIDEEEEEGPDEEMSPQVDGATSPELDEGEVRIPSRDDAVVTFTPSADSKPLHAVSVSPTAPNVVACAGEDDIGYIVDIGGESPHGRLVVTLNGHTDTITKVAFNPKGDMIATAAMDSTVKLWSPTGTLLFSLEELQAEVESLLWHPSGLVLAAGAADAQAVMWNATKGTCLQYFSGNTATVSALAWAEDNKKLVTGSGDSNVMIFNPKTAESTGSIRKISECGAGVNTLALATPDTVVVGCEDGTIAMVSTSQAKLLHRFPSPHEQCIEAITCSAEYQFFVCCSCDCRLTVWDMRDYTLRTTFTTSEGITSLAWHNALVVCGCVRGDVVILDARSPKGTPALATLQGHAQTVLSVAVTSLAPADTKVVSVSDDGTLRVFPLLVQ